jgi:hypothetical protein
MKDARNLPSVVLIDGVYQAERGKLGHEYIESWDSQGFRYPDPGETLTGYSTHQRFHRISPDGRVYSLEVLL